VLNSDENICRSSLFDACSEMSRFAITLFFDAQTASGAALAMDVAIVFTRSRNPAASNTSVTRPDAFAPRALRIAQVYKSSRALKSHASMAAHTR
jgi:hypothetical protein